MNYPKFQKIVEQIIVKYGKMSLEDFYKSPVQLITIARENFDDFIIEKEDNCLRVGYYYVKNGVKKSDPIFEFEIKGITWFPTVCEQILMNTKIGELKDGSYHYGRSTFKDVEEFSTLCANEWKQYYL